MRGWNPVIDTRRRGGRSPAGMADLPDEQLVRLFADEPDGAGASALAFEALVRRHGPMVLATCRRWSGDRHEAEDSFQLTFCVLARKAGSIQQPALLGQWLHGVAVRTARRARERGERRRRHERRHAVLEAGLAAAGPARNDLGLVRREEAEILHQEIARLPEVYRLPVVLCDLGSLTHVQAAERLRWPAGTLSVRLSRARRLLRARLRERGLALAVGLPVRLPLRRGTAPPVACHAARAGSPVLANSLRSTTLLARPALAALALPAVLLALIAAIGLPHGRVRLDPGERATAAPVPPLPEPGEPVPAGAGPVHREPTVPGRQAEAAVPSDPANGADRPLDDVRLDAELRAYRARERGAGRDAAAQVRLALWCEAHGLDAERLKHLALAVLIDPDHLPARGLLGQVAHLGRWRSPDDVAARLEADTQHAAARAAYVARRARMKDTADGHWQLALWCVQRGLDVEARAHLVAVTRRDPTREAAWRRLGHVPYRGRWLPPGEAAARKRADELQAAADRLWKPLLAKWRSALRAGARRAGAEAKFATVTDPLAVPAIMAVLGRGSRDDQALAVRVLGQIDGPAASQALAALAVFAEEPAVRRVATEVLGRRDSHDAVGLLVDLLQEPIRYDLQLVDGPGRAGALLVEGPAFNVRRHYPVPALPDEVVRRILDPTTPPRLLLPAPVAEAIGPEMTRIITHSSPAVISGRNLWFARINLIEAARATALTQGLQLEDARLLETANRSIRQFNARVELPLRVLTGQDLGSSRQAWKAWWTDHQGYAQRTAGPSPKPTLDVVAPVAYLPRYRDEFSMHSCFAVGTPVLTREGPRPIESIAVGDAVLSQDTTSGALSFAPVVAALRNPPAPTLRVDLGGGSVSVTGIHRFWVAGRGWVMARALKPGDAVRTPGGLARVGAVSAEPVQPVFNLEVEGSHSFFVGDAGALVHDNSTVEPVPHPFDERLEPPTSPAARAF